MSSIFNKMKKLLQNGDNGIKVQKIENGSSEAKELGSGDADDLKKFHKEQQMKQQIFDRIHAVIDEYGGLDEWGPEIEKVLSVGIRKTFTNAREIEFLLITSGDFIMGSNEYDPEKPVHQVTIQRPFYMGKYPVTQKQWKNIMRSNPSRFKGDDRPVENVSWKDAQEFITKLNKIEDTDKYRLPSSTSPIDLYSQQNFTHLLFFI